MKKTLALIAASLALTSCGELKEFATPYTIDSVSFVETGGRVTDIAVTPADERVTLTATMNGTVRSGAPTTNGVIRTENNQSVLGAICPGANTVQYDIKVLGRSMYDAPQSASFNYPTSSAVATGEDSLEISSSGEVGTNNLRLVEEASVNRCGIKTVEFEQSVRKTAPDGSVTISPSTDLKLTSRTFSDADGRGVAVDVVGLIPGTYIVTAKVNMVNAQTLSKNFVVRVR